ncbi:Alkali-sensitive linkage protein 1 [Cyphellophora attinorum]|uniref:Alkali-sensitive linkage protein 1 n=1 Tax=Cyphellophora attinorum TaxID=1664694 RepID=A0A0N1NZW5_9EURO|nr:Alkali-sensitive linkage protein 1 [Phialophora attinorum]KPI39286.1 Alkali-sensitive linkage protein 1 [Phialophora attinorum]
MVSSKSLALAALSSLAVATPHGHKHQHVPKHIPHGTGPRGPRGSGRPHGFPMGNGTWHDAPFPTGTGAGSPPVLSITVNPLPEQPTGGAAAPVGGASPPDVNNNVPALPTETPVADATRPVDGGSGVAPAGGDAPVAGGAPGGGSPPAGGAGQCTPTTVTVTVDEVVTVSSASGGAPSSPAGGDAPPVDGEAPASPSSDAPASLTNIQQPSGGEFYGRPTGGYGGQHGGQSDGYSYAPALPTTFATATTPAAGNGGGYGAAPSATTSGAVSVPTGGSGGIGSGNSGGSSGGKRGLSFNDANILTPFDGTGMTWAYNWASTENGALPAGVEFFPMCWGRDSIASFAKDAAGAKHVLSFNEPDLAEQAGMTVQEAVDGHIKAVNPLAAQGAVIGSPAVTNGGSPMGLAFLQNWFTACAGQCKVDAVVIHWYDNANNLAYFKSHVNDAIQLAKANGVSKVWITEFGVTGGDAATFISEATAFLDATPEVEFYAYFMAAQGVLLNGSGLSAAGKAYVGQ